MSQENVELVLRAMAAFVERDTEALVECATTDCEFPLPRNLLEGGSYRGHEGLRRAVGDAFETWEEFRFDLQDVRVIDDRVLAWAEAPT